MKKKMDALTKVKLIYSGELFVIALAMLIVSCLEFSKVIVITQRHHEIFNWITIIGGSWLVIDFCWMFKSKKRREKGTFLDKISLLPLGIYLITFDIISFINYNKMPQDFYQYGIPSAVLYISLAYFFQSIYHWYHPLPELVEEIKKEQEEEEKIKQAETQQENAGIISSTIEEQINNDDNKKEN